MTSGEELHFIGVIGGMLGIIVLSLLLSTCILCVSSFRLFYKRKVADHYHQAKYGFRISYYINYYFAQHISVQCSCNFALSNFNCSTFKHYLAMVSTIPCSITCFAVLPAVDDRH